MERNQKASCVRPMGWVVMVVFLGIVLGPGLASAQFGLPKIPKLPKKVTKKAKDTKESENATPEVTASGVGSPEVAQISPNEAPPGGQGEVVLTGKGFGNGLSLNFNCKGAQFEPKSIKVESPTRAVANIAVPVSAEEGPCGLSLKSSQSGEPFKISNSAGMPVTLPVLYMGEGDMDFMAIMQKMSQVMMKQTQGNWQEAGAQANKPPSGLVVEGGSLKFVDEGKAVFTEPGSNVKAIQEMHQGDQAVGIFRIVFNDGKIQNFMDREGGSKKGSGVAAYLKKKYGK